MENLKKEKIIYLFLEPFQKGYGGYTHAVGLMEALEVYYHILFIIPSYSKKNPFPSDIQRMFVILWTQICALFLLFSVKKCYIRAHFMGVFFSFFAFIFKKSVFLEINGPVSDAFVHRKAPFFLKKIADIFWHFQLKLATGIFVVTPQLAQHIQDIYGIPHQKIYLIPNAAFEKDLKKKPIDYKGEYALYIGSFTKWQGLEILLKALDFKEFWPAEVPLHIYGHGPLLPLILAYSKKHPLIQYKGFAQDFDKSQIFHQAFVSLMPFSGITPQSDRPQYGLSPIKFYESLAHSIPVISTNIPYISKLVQEKELGIIISTDSPEALAKAVKKIWKDETFRFNCCKNAYQFIQQGNTWTHRAQEIHQIFSSWKSK